MELFSPSPRIAKLLILYETLLNDREMLKALFALATPLHVDDHESGRGRIYYVCCDESCPLFDAQLDDKGEEWPEYRLAWAYDCVFPDAESEKRRVNSGKFGFAAFRQTIVRAPAAQLALQSHRTNVH